MIEAIPSNVTVELKSWITFFASGDIGPFLKIDKGVQTLPVSIHERAPMCAFSILQKWQKIGKMTQDDLLTLTMVSSESLENTEEKKKDFNGNNAMYSLRKNWTLA